MKRSKTLKEHSRTFIQTVRNAERISIEFFTNLLYPKPTILAPTLMQCFKRVCKETQQDLVSEKQSFTIFKSLGLSKNTDLSFYLDSTSSYIKMEISASRFRRKFFPFSLLFYLQINYCLLSFRKQKLKINNEKNLKINQIWKKNNE